MRFEVQHYTLGDGWTNCWTTTTQEGLEMPTVFKTYTQALNALTEHLADQLDSYSKGLMDTKYDINQYRIMEVM